MSFLSQNECFNPEGHDTFTLAYSHISRIPISDSCTLVSFAGQIGRDSSTNTIPSTLVEQCLIAFANVDKCLASVNACKEDIVQVRQYVVDLQQGGNGMNPERAKQYIQWMGGARPPSTVLGVQSLAHKDLLYEIEVVAIVNRS